MNGLTQWKDGGQLWFWSSRSLVWVQTDQCEGGFAAVRLLHLIPGCITQPIQSNSTQTRGLPLPSKDVEEYCIASCTTEVISLLQQSLTWISSKVSKPHCVRVYAKTNLFSEILKHSLWSKVFSGCNISLLKVLQQKALPWLLPRVLNNAFSYFPFFSR